MLYHDDATPVKLTTEQRAELFAEPEIQACKRRQAEIMKSLEREGKTLATASDETQIEYKRAFMDQSNAYRRLYPVVSTIGLVLPPDASLRQFLPTAPQKDTSQAPRSATRRAAGIFREH